MGLLPSDGLSPFQENNSLSDADLRDYVEAVTRVVNHKIQEWIYINQHSSQVLIDKICTLVYDGWFTREGQLVRATQGYDTPVFHDVMDQLITLTFEENSRPREGVRWNPEIQLTVVSLTQYIRDCVEYLDELETPVPDITQKRVHTDRNVGRNKMLFYRALRDELMTVRLSSR